METERSSTQVVHMECKETGELAHRETSEYEQLETFNNKVVSENRGGDPRRNRPLTWARAKYSLDGTNALGPSSTKRRRNTPKL